MTAVAQPFVWGRKTTIIKWIADSNNYYDRYDNNIIIIIENDITNIYHLE